MEILRGPAGRAILHAATTILLSACFVFLAHGQTSQQVTYSIGQTTSTLTVATPAIALNPLRPAQYFFAYGNPRTYAFGDFNGDGLADIAIAPSYYDKLPERPIEFWINQGDGLFRDGTSEVLRGAKVLTGNVNAVFVADFNEDGRPDVFLLDTGMEVNQPFFPGHRLGLLISQPDGSLIDASDRLSPNAVEYNHAGAVADMNGDGHLDLVVTRMGGRLEADGTLMFAGDGKGNFTATAAGFSNQIAYLPWTSVDFANDRQNQGCSTATDLDGDGRTDLITGTYSNADTPTGKRTIRFHQQQPDGTFIERSRVEIPTGIRDVGYFGGVRTGLNDGLGCASIVTGELFGNGRQDVVILWEGANSSYIEILRNDGQLAFSDMTVASFGDYRTTGPLGSVSTYRLLDVNGDGALDIITGAGESASRLTGGSSVFLNDGHGVFSGWIPQTTSGPMLATHLTAVTGCDWCGLVPLVFDVDGDGQPDVVLLNFQSSVTAAPMQTSAVQLTTLFNRPPSGFPPVIEFYNSLLDHYFITANGSESAAIDGGSAGPGWARTGGAFLSGGSTPVCRFYGSRSPGPNSHFYTVDPDECASLKILQSTLPDTQPRWNFESLDFKSRAPRDRSCPNGTVPVYRAYNNGFIRHVDSNHRITTSTVAVAEVVNRGWMSEGVVMCAPR